MNAPRIDTPARPECDSDLTGVLDNYLAALRRGEHPSKETLLRDHPHLAAELSGCLQTLDMLQDCANFDVEIDEGDGAAVAQRSLGDYRILREVGRGGMGVVYEADQISLARRVALKILPFAAVLDPRHLQRFKNEAMAAAHLDHPNIVEVYGIGCERSIHFYAMRFIEGVTLAEVVEAKRRLEAGGERLEERSQEWNVESNPKDEARTEAFSPSQLLTFSPSSHSSLITPHSSLGAETERALQAALSTVNSHAPRERFRRIAEIGIQAAEALDHAHQMGIVHRDIKPSNLMLDERGKLWVTDFGLARSTGEASMTMTGDLVGTLRYMSPEQALAKRITVDHRTDIYSLGVTLYELLTLRAAFPSNDREETLRQIAFEEPTSPRKLDKSIPEELETIILKAMEKNPDDRYATARDVAEDLRRWVEHKPIAARAPGVSKRTLKLARRHAGIVGTALIGLTFVTITLVCALVFLNSAYQRETEQLKRIKFENELGWRVLQNALGVIDQAVIAFGAHELRTVPGTAQLRRNLFAETLTFSESLARDTEEPTAQLTVPRMRLLLAAEERALGNVEGAISLEELAANEYGELVAFCERHPEYVPALADRLCIHLDNDRLSGDRSTELKTKMLGALLPLYEKLPESFGLFNSAADAAATYARMRGRDPALAKTTLRALAKHAAMYEPLLLDQIDAHGAIGVVYEQLGELERFESPAQAAEWFARAAGVYERWYAHSHITAMRVADGQVTSPEGAKAAELLCRQAQLVRPGERESLLQKAVTISQAENANNYAYSCACLADHYMRENRLAEAEATAMKSVDTWRLELKGRSAVDLAKWRGHDDVSIGFETLIRVLELKGQRAQVRLLYDEEIAYWRSRSQETKPLDPYCMEQLVRAELAAGAFEFVAGSREDARKRYSTALRDARGVINERSNYPFSLVRLQRRAAYQLLRSSDEEWRRPDKAAMWLRAVEKEEDAYLGEDFMNALYSLRSGRLDEAIELLESQEPSVVLAIALAKSDRDNEAIEVVKKVEPDLGYHSMDRCSLREYELQLRECADELGKDVREMKLATPFLERWIRRPLEPAKTD